MNRIKELRTKNNLNMREAAKRLGIPYTTYVNYEKGKREPNQKMLITLADFFNTSTDYLLGRGQPQPIATANAREVKSMPKPKMSLGKRIKQRREELGISQDELANKLGYNSRSSISKIEADINDLTQTKIIAFAEALCTTPEYLMECKEVNEMDLSQIPTYKLVEELKRREGVDVKIAEPYEDIAVSVNGPAVVLVVID